MNKKKREREREKIDLDYPEKCRMDADVARQPVARLDTAHVMVAPGSLPSTW